MKKTNLMKTILILAISSSFTTSFAQTNNTVTVTTPTTTSVTPNQEKVGDGNTYEKSVTPLLREISRKKSILSIKELDKKIRELDEDEKESKNASSKNNTPKKDNQTTGHVPIPTPTSNPNGPIVSPMAALGNQNLGANIPVNSVKVLMIYGKIGDLYAKISMGDQGGYPVKRGDILPDGSVVNAIYDNYIEVKKVAVVNKKPVPYTEKIYISGLNQGNSRPAQTFETAPILSGGQGIIPATGPAAAMSLNNSNSVGSR